MPTPRNAGFWLLFGAATVILILLTITASVTLYRSATTAPICGHLAMLVIFALLLGLMVWAILKTGQAE